MLKFLLQQDPLWPDSGLVPPLPQLELSFLRWPQQNSDNKASCSLCGLELPVTCSLLQEQVTMKGSWACEGSITPAASPGKTRWGVRWALWVRMEPRACLKEASRMGRCQRLLLQYPVHSFRSQAMSCARYKGEVEFLYLINTAKPRVRSLLGVPV